MTLESSQSEISSAQAKLFEFAYYELIMNNRDMFQPLWTVDSWVKFLIWLSLSCGFSGDEKSLGNFILSLGDPLTKRMRQIFFERRFDESNLHIIADPCDKEVFVMSIDNENKTSLSFDKVLKVLEQIKLDKEIIRDNNFWSSQDGVIRIPRKVIN